MATRRQFLVGTLPAMSLARHLHASSTTLQARLDEAMRQFMEDRGTPGGALAITKDRELIYCKGYGIADRQTNADCNDEFAFSSCKFK